MTDCPVNMGASIVLALLAFLLPAGQAGAADTPSQTASAVPVRYKIDASKSRFIVRAFVEGLFSVFGHDHTIAIREFNGEALFVPGTGDAASLQLTINANSLGVTDNLSEEDRKEIESTMRQEVLETSKYPEIVFRSTSISANKNPDGSYQVKISGNLSLHGVTRNGSIDATVNVDGDTLRAKGQFPLFQTDYKITPVSVAIGAVRVKDELQLSFDIVAVKQ